MRRIQRSVHRELLRILEQEGYPEVRIQHLNVFALVPRDDGMRMSDLADRLQLTPGAVTQMVHQLVTLRLLERVRDPADGRAVLVRPTATAEAGYESSRRRIAGLEAEWETLVGPRRWATFRQVLSELADHEERRSETTRTGRSTSGHPG
jgi:DNA-binding MarR family transcriptional regulator